MVKIESFGQLSEITGKTIEVDITDTDQLIAVLRDQFKVPGNSRYLIAVNRKIVITNTSLDPSDTIALLPPYSGG